MIESYTTIVSAYFKLPISKTTHDNYVLWMKNMLLIDNPMVIFCDKESEEMILFFRKEKIEKTKLIITSFSEFYCFKYIEHFNKHCKKDEEVKLGHNVNLYMIWNEKTNFLKRAIEYNFFHSEYFLWVDIGCFREPNPRYFGVWPNPDKILTLDKNKVLMLLVKPFEKTELLCRKKEELPDFQFTYRIGAPIFGGGKDILLKWHELYYEMLEYFIHIDRFIGKDQNIMNSLVLIEKKMCCLIKAYPPKNQWFYLQEYLSLSPFNELQKESFRIILIAPGYTPLPPKGWGAVENILWDYYENLKKRNINVKIINTTNINNIIFQCNNYCPTMIHIMYDDYIVITPFLHCRNIYYTSHYAYLTSPTLKKDHKKYFEEIFFHVIKNKDIIKINAISEEIKQVYINYGFPKEKINVIRNGSREDLFNFNLYSNINTQSTLLAKSIYVAKIEFRKCQYKYQSLENIDFVGNYKDSSFNISNPNYLGEWSREKIYKNLTNYGNLVLLSEGEADPLVVKEALMSGLGVILSECCTANLDLTKEFITVIPNDKLNDLNYIQKKINENRVISLNNRENIRKYALDNFSWNNIIFLYLQTIKP